jgi:hypothetical protein
MPDLEHFEIILLENSELGTAAGASSRSIEFYDRWGKGTQ